MAGRFVGYLEAMQPGRQYYVRVRAANTEGYGLPGISRPNSETPRMAPGRLSFGEVQLKPITATSSVSVL